MWKFALREKFASVTDLISLWRCNWIDSSGPEHRHGDQMPRNANPSAAEVPVPEGRELEDASLLLCRMAALHIDWDELARIDPLTLSRLQNTCAHCKSRATCELELSHVSIDASWGEWREYCPNARKLNELRIASAIRRDS
jgi:hypothetical protein